MIGIGRSEQFDRGSAGLVGSLQLFQNTVFQRTGEKPSGTEITTFSIRVAISCNRCNHLRLHIHIIALFLCHNAEAMMINPANTCQITQQLLGLIGLPHPCLPQQIQGFCQHFT